MGARNFQPFIFVVACLIIISTFMLTSTANGSALTPHGHKDKDKDVQNSKIPHSSSFQSFTECVNCHKAIKSNLPSLAELRMGWNKRELVKGEVVYRTRCEDCHRVRTYMRQVQGLKHKIRPVGSHLKCVECHELNTGMPVAKVWEGNDYSEKFCFRCHQRIRDDFTFSTSHRLRSFGIACAGCHKPHEAFYAIIIKEMMPDNWNGIADFLVTNELCFSCHSWLEVSGEGSKFRTAILNLHSMHVEEKTIACIECHNPHGGSEQHQLRRFTITGEPFTFLSSGEEGGSCTVLCHGRQHTATAYAGK